MFIAIGDLHLTDHRGKGGLSSYLKNHDQMVTKLVGQALTYAEAKGITHVFLLGDICDGPRMSYSATKALLSILRTNFQFHIILGNHDMLGTSYELGHSLELIKEFNLPNVHIYEKPTLVKLEGKLVNFLPNPSTDFKSKALNVCHVDLQGAISDSGRVLTGATTDATCIVGHIHKNQIVNRAYYSGTLYQTNFGESAEKFFLHIDYDGDWIVENIPVRPKVVLSTIEVSQPSDLDFESKDLIKLILLPGCGVEAKHYSHLNVVKVRPLSSVKDLGKARIEDLVEGSAVRIKTLDFLTEYFLANNIEPTLSNQALRIRKELLCV